MEPSREPTLSLFSAKDFVPEKYVKDLSQNCVGGPELRRLRKKIHSLLEDTNTGLKKNVYQNYMQFIDTAKEISHLESEMYQLSHLLSEQKSLLGALATTSILGEEATLTSETETKENTANPEIENKQKLATILEKVEGCKEIVEVSGKIYLHEGDLLELDPVENMALKTVHAYLFNDGLMIATRNANSRGLMKYVFEVMYELGSLAVVNVRDLGNVKHAFKLLIFPDTRVFQCSSNNTKKEWLDKFDQAKKARLTHDKQKRESIVEKSPSRAASLDSPNINPFDEPEEEIGNVHPDWFLEIPEELDVCVAQRHFEDALGLLQKAKDYISQFQAANQQPDNVINDIQRKVDQRHNHLTEVLMKELEVNPDKSLQGGLRAARRAVRLLNQLGHSTESGDLFLKLCSSMLKTQCKRVKREGSTTMYIRHLSSVVFTNMCHMTEEFLRAFPDNPSCASAYVVWASSEMSLFATHFIKQVFMPQTSLSTITECVVLVRKQCERLCSYGVDLCYLLDGALRTPLTKALREARDKFIDSIKLKSTEDKWVPLNLRSKSGLVRCIQEHADMGLKLDNFTKEDETWLQLTSNTVSFTKLYLAFLGDCLQLKTSDLVHTIDETLYDILEFQIQHLESSLKKEGQPHQRQFITKNAQFLLINLLELVQKQYFKVNDFECEKLKKLQRDHSALSQGIVPTSRTTRKYSSEIL